MPIDKKHVHKVFRRHLQALRGKRNADTDAWNRTIDDVGGAYMGTDESSERRRAVGDVIRGIVSRRPRRDPFPKIAQIARLCVSVKKQISDEYRAYDDDDRPGILLTVGANKNGDWSYQTGDTQFMGGAYGYPYWGQAAIYRSTNCNQAAKQIIDEILEAAAQDVEE